MRIPLITIYLLFLSTSSVEAQKPAIQTDCLKSLMRNWGRQNSSWVYCQNIGHLFNSDTLILQSIESTVRLPAFCDSDTISIITFGDGRALISEKSKSDGKINDVFSTVNTYQTAFKKKRKSTIVVFKNFDNTFVYKLSELKQNSIDLNYIVILVKEKNFR